MPRRGAPLLIQEGWRAERRGGYPREGVFPKALKNRAEAKESS